MSAGLIVTYKAKKAGALDAEYFRERALRARRLSKAKPMLKPVLQAAQKDSLAEAPVRKRKGKLGPAVARVHVLRVRKNTVTFGTKIPYSPFYAGWYRRAMSQELIVWNDKLARAFVDVILQYIDKGRP